jgi:hypothetical protein
MNPVNRMFKDETIIGIEKHYNATYVVDACLKNINGAWVNFPAAIFHTETAHPQGSNYMAMYWSENDGWMVTNGFEAVQGVFHGIVFDDGELVHSRFRHDYFVHREAMADGARDYHRTNTCPQGSRHIKFKVDGAKLVEYTMEDELIDEYDRMAAMPRRVA